MRLAQQAGITISLLLLIFGFIDITLQWANGEVVHWRVPLFLIGGGSISALGLFLFLEPAQAIEPIEYDENDLSTEYGDQPGFLDKFTSSDDSSGNSSGGDCDD